MIVEKLREIVLGYRRCHHDSLSLVLVVVVLSISSLSLNFRVWYNRKPSLKLKVIALHYKLNYIMHTFFSFLVSVHNFTDPYGSLLTTYARLVYLAKPTVSPEGLDIMGLSSEKLM